MRFVLYAILIYLAYRFIFYFIIPVYLTSRKIKKGFRDMQDRMNEQMNQNRQKAYSTTPSPGAEKPKPRAEDYLDFEEIK